MPATPSRLEAVLAYSLSALTMLLWLGCVVPAGDIELTAGEDREKTRQRAEANRARLDQITVALQKKLQGR